MSAASSRMPVVFFGHGNPMNAIEDNAYSKAWRRVGEIVPRPKGILSVSAHWYTNDVAVTAMEYPRTIHDFGGFPKELYEVQYQAQGDQQLAARVRDLLKPANVTLDQDWGLDHGTWSVLCHVFPNADVPVVQLSLDGGETAAFHYELAKRLLPLRDEGILVIGSGNLVHNLHAYAWGRHPARPFDWAIRFENWARARILAGDEKALVAYEDFGKDAKLAVPTPEHYLPLLYVLALRGTGEIVRFPTEGIDGGSVSMLSVAIGL